MADILQTLPAKPHVRADVRVDAVGRLCPIPVTWTAAAVRSLRPGQIVELCADDPMAVLDMRCWCVSWGHDYLGDESRQGVLHIFVRKASRSAEPRS
jgi:TusA-related sulfurtransferase